MKKGLGVLFVILGLIMIVGFSAVGTYNGLVKTREGVDAAWAQVLSQYQRRADLVPNLVKTVEGSANFEKSTLESVVNARASVGRVNIDTSKAPDEATLQKFQEAQGQFSSALSRLLVVAENYPDLKASAGFRDLQAQLEGTENRIAGDREAAVTGGAGAIMAAVKGEYTGDGRTNLDQDAPEGAIWPLLLIVGFILLGFRFPVLFSVIDVMFSAGGATSSSGGGRSWGGGGSSSSGGGFSGGGGRSGGGGASGGW